MRKNKKIIMMVSLVVSLIGFNVYGFADDLMQSIEVFFNQINIEVNGEQIDVDNILYNGTTYAPLRTVAEMLGKEVGWDGETNTVSIKDKDNTEIVVSTNEPFMVNGYYAMNSNKQFTRFEENKSIEYIDTMSFGWSKIEYDEETKKINLNMTAKNGNSFNVPYGYSEFLDNVKKYNISTQLNVYADNNFDEIFQNRDIVIKQIVDSVNGIKMYEDNIEFDNVVIDFEVLQEEQSELFIEFLSELKEKLIVNDKKLYVAVPPRIWNKSYNYRQIGQIADYVILMAHDFDDKSLDAEYMVNDVVYTPLTPISAIEQALEDITNELDGVEEPSKVLLQLSFGTAQWKMKDGKLYDNDANIDDGIVHSNKPTYEMLYDRLKFELESGREIESVMYYDEKSGNPYIKYYNDLDQTDNVIWYEDSRSIVEKIELAKKFKIGGVSIWRIGNIPEYFNPKGYNMYLDVWQQIIENL